MSKILTVPVTQAEPEMLHLSGFDRFAWMAGFAGQLMLVATLFARRRTGAFPMFTTYIAIQAVITLALYPVASHYPYRTYERWYWAMELLDEIFQLLVIYEVAVHVFRPTGVWARDVRKTFLAVGGISTVVALLLVWVAQPEAPRAIEIFILRSNLFSAVLMSELFVGMVVLSSTSGLPWKTHTARIAQGLGTYSIVCVVLDIVANLVGLSHGRRIHAELGRLGVAVYLACEAYWIVMLWAEAPAPRELPDIMRAQIYSLQRQVENDLIRIRSWRNS